VISNFAAYLILVIWVISRYAATGIWPSILIFMALLTFLAPLVFYVPLITLGTAGALILVYSMSLRAANRFSARIGIPRLRA
jgi:hypothetical protein